MNFVVCISGSEGSLLLVLTNAWLPKCDAQNITGQLGILCNFLPRETRASQNVTDLLKRKKKKKKWRNNSCCLIRINSMLHLNIWMLHVWAVIIIPQSLHDTLVGSIQLKWCHLGLNLNLMTPTLSIKAMEQFFLNLEFLELFLFYTVYMKPKNYYSRP